VTTGAGTAGSDGRVATAAALYGVTRVRRVRRIERSHEYSAHDWRTYGRVPREYGYDGHGGCRGYGVRRWHGLRRGLVQRVRPAAWVRRPPCTASRGYDGCGG